MRRNFDRVLADVWRKLTHKPDPPRIVQPRERVGYHPHHGSKVPKSKRVLRSRRRAKAAHESRRVNFAIARRHRK
jgi:hypothetical protein